MITRLIKAWAIPAPTKELMMMTMAKTNSMARTRLAHRMLMAGSAAALALVALGFSNTAQARDNVTFSVGIGLPGIVVGASNAYPVYSQPQVVYVQPQPVYVQPRTIYVQPRPVYVQPAPVYYQSAPVYYGPQPIYAVPQPMYYGRPHEDKHGHHKKHGWKNKDHDDRRGHERHGYAPVYYQR